VRAGVSLGSLSRGCKPARRRRPTMNMPTYFYTFHAYRSWMPDHPRGYTRRGVGVVPPNEKMNQRYVERSKFDELEFDSALQNLVVDAIAEVCSNLKTDLYYAVAVSTHAHAVAECANVDPLKLHDTMKRIIGLKLARFCGVEGRTWLSRGRDLKPVRDVKHLEHLLYVYLPGHHGATFIADRVQRE
jgi:hypothetical protein